MSLYAVQDNVGNYWDFDNRGFHSPQNNARRNTTFNLALADAIVQMNGGHVVELVEKPTPVVVSEAESEMLKEAKDTTAWRPAAVISAYAYDNTKDPDDEALLEDRLMRAYVNGWTVEKQKRWNVKVPHVNNGYYYKDSDGLAVFTAKRGRMLQERSQFTAAEIEENGLQDCEKVECDLR